jgi:two-component system chemotaxis response regulator CheY
MAKILIVDDSDVLRMELKSVLVGGGHTVIEGDNGLEGLKRAQENDHLDLIITDLNMPEMDGITMCRRVRGLAAHQKTPIFMLTTESSAELKSSGKEVGVMVWIVKPFSADKVLAGVSKVIEMQKKAS